MSEVNHPTPPQPPDANYAENPRNSNAENPRNSNAENPRNSNAENPRNSNAENPSNHAKKDSVDKHAENPDPTQAKKDSINNPVVEPPPPEESDASIDASNASIDASNASIDASDASIDAIIAFENAAAEAVVENLDKDHELNAANHVSDDEAKTASTEKRRSSLLEILKKERLTRLTKNASEKDKKKKSIADRAKIIIADLDKNEIGPLPPPDYYYKTDAGDMDEVHGEHRYTPIGRNAVEMGSRFYVERNLFSYLANTRLPFEENFYDDIFVDSACYTNTPNAYIILGKPGIGKATLGRRLAEKLNTIFISPKEVVDHYRDVENHKKIKELRVNEILEAGGSIGDTIVAKLIQARIAELDVLHIGYVMAGFPMTTSEDITIEEQIEILETLALPPKYAFIMNMQDVDLYKRRIEQKMDPETSIIYGRVHYSKFNPDENVFPTPGAAEPRKSSINRPFSAQYPRTSVASSDVGHISEFSDMDHHIPDSQYDQQHHIHGDGNHELGRKVSMYIGLTNPIHDKILDPDEPEDPLDGSRDFIPLRPHVIFHLVSRTEDNPLIVNDDLELFRDKLPALQSYLEKFDRRKVLELDGYWAPSVILKRAYEYLESCCGVSAIPIPVQILPIPEPDEEDDNEEEEVEKRGEQEGEDAGESTDYLLRQLKLKSIQQQHQHQQEETLGEEFGGEFGGEGYSYSKYNSYPYRRFGPPKFHRQPPSPVELAVVVPADELMSPPGVNNYQTSSEEAEEYSTGEENSFPLPEDEEEGGTENEEEEARELHWHVATRISETELREEDQEILEALMKMGDPENDSDPLEIPNWGRYGNKKRKVKKSPRSSDDEDDSEEESEEKSGESEAGEDDLVGEDQVQNVTDILASLESRPDQYAKLLKRMEDERCFGDTKYYCPVTFVEQNLLRKGSPQFACKFRYRLYYCADEDALEKFMENPTAYLTEGAPHVPPPPRICITGSPGCGQEEIGLKLAKEYNICYINFRQRLHELVKARLGREVGPNKTGSIVNWHESERQVSGCKSSDDIIKMEEKKKSAEEEEKGRSSALDGTKKKSLEVRGEDWGNNEQEEETEADEGIEEDKEEEEELGENDGDDKKKKVRISLDGGEEGENDDDLEVDEARRIISTNPTLHPFLQETKSEELAINEAAMRSLGLLEPADLSTVPIGSLERTERLTERKWKKLTKIETYAQAFLENGVQLPDLVLDEFIAPLFKEVPFSKVGFILVGFPNTEEDVNYLVKRNILPEAVFVMESQQLVVRNRLLRDAVDRWHVTQNPSGKRKKKLSSAAISALRLKAKFEAQAVAAAAQKKKKKKKNDGSGDANNWNETGFLYQSEGRPVIEEFEEETWGYKDAISAKITTALKHYHTVFSRNIRSLKMSLNKNRVDWLPNNTDVNLFASKRALIENITPLLKYRTSVFEDTVRLTMVQANTMMNYGLYLSRFQRWCPVELYKGNTALNMWNAPSIPKIPIVHRRYIYFLAGEKNAKLFQQNCWDIINQETAMNPVPAVVVIRGPPKSGKTTLAKKLSQRLGLVYISGPEMIEGVIKHSFVSQFGDILHELEPTTLAGAPQPMLLAEEILNYVRDGHTVPKFMLYRVLDLVLQQPKAQYHGIVFDDYPLTEQELQELLYRGVVPSTVIELKIDLEEARARCQRNRNLEYDYIDLPEDGDAAIEYATMRYNSASETTLDWFQNEVQNTKILDGTQNKEWIYQKAENKIKSNVKKMQNYLTNVLLEKPSTLDGTCPLTSQIPDRLSPEFGFYCPVALNDNDDLIRVSNFSNLSEVVEYMGRVYLFANRGNLENFLANPNMYVAPNCERVPPTDLPSMCPLTPTEFMEVKNHWGFMDFDPVLYYNSNSQYNGLKRGDPKYCVSYRNKIYCFVSEDSMKEFMRKPERFWDQDFPSKYPKKPDPNEMDKITWYSYFIKNGLFSDLKNVIRLAGEQRPKVPFVNPNLTATMFMGYYFKSQNMNIPYEIRQKYRSAMFDMAQQKHNSKKFLQEFKGRDNFLSNMEHVPSAKTRARIDEFMEMEDMDDEELILIPPTVPGTIPWDLTLAGLRLEEKVEEIRTRTKNKKLLLQEVEKKGKEPFLTFFEQRQAGDFLPVDDHENPAQTHTIAAYSTL